MTVTISPDEREDYMDVRLGPKDSAIVLRDSGKMDIILAKPQNDDDVADKSALTAVVVVEFLQDRDLVKLISDRVEAKAKKLQN